MGCPMMDSSWCGPKVFAIYVKTHRIRRLDVQGDRLRSLGVALHSFLHLGIGMHSMRGLSSRGSRRRSLGGAHCRFLAVAVGTHRIRDPNFRGSR